MTNRCYESMTRVRIRNGAWIVRVWVTETKFVRGPNPMVLAVLNDPQRSWTPNTIAKALDSLGHVVAAYEILDANGHGAVVYPDWK